MDRSKVYIIGIHVIALFLALLWACGGIQFPGVKDGDVYDYGHGMPPPVPSEGKIALLTWNISYAYGIGSSGQGYVPHSPAEFQGRLERIGKIIKESEADIVFLQEVDFDSHRSHHVNQLEELAKVSGLRYAASVISWEANYIPFPLWPPQHHFGMVHSGGAVLSRYPIINNQAMLHPKPSRNFWLRNMFYLFRYSQWVQIQIGSRDVIVINNHLESYDKDNRVLQANVLAKMIEIIDNSKYVIIFGGDMNTIPRGASVRYSYADDERGDFRDDATMEIISGIGGFKEVVSYEESLRDEAAFFTYPSNAPNRRLDYIFVPGNMKVLEARVLVVGSSSDHLPVKAILEWNYN